MTGKRNKDAGRRAEAAVAKRRPDRRVVPLSGAGSIKGDVLGDHELIQVKSSRQYQTTKAGRGSKQITVRLDDLAQMEREAALERKPLAVMYLHFSGERRDWVVMSATQYETLLAAWEGGRE